MKHLFILFSICLLNIVQNVHSQVCGLAQNLSISQESQISGIKNALDTALKYENLHQIDSLSVVLKSIYANEGGKPDAIESYFSLNSNVTWLSMPNAILLSRALITADSVVYANLWKTAKGMSPPSYQPNSIFLRASAEIAAGLLKIAYHETDLTRKNLYQTWALKAFDSLATMQLPNGAFPFPDLRTYNDPTFSPIIQNFLNACGNDSVNVLQNGWIIDDKGTGEFKYDAGIISNAFYDAYLYSGNTAYKNIVISIGNYLLPLKFNLNYNYNTFVALGLTRAYQLSNNSNYLNRAIANLRYAVAPGQLSNGRWVDGHNANSRYHNLMIQNFSPTLALIPTSYTYKGKLDSMCLNSIQNLVNYTSNCNSATGFRWLMKAYQLNANLLSPTLLDSVKNLIGEHINQAAINGKYLDVPTMGEYLELISGFLDVEDKIPSNTTYNIYPNPASQKLFIKVNNNQTEKLNISVYDLNGRFLHEIEAQHINSSPNVLEIDLSSFCNGTYFLNFSDSSKNFVYKIIVLQ